MKDKSIRNDAERRRHLFAERNAPISEKDYQVEATNEINPLTGEKYGSRINFGYFLEVDSLISIGFPMHHYPSSMNTLEKKDDSNKYEFMKYQFALAAMDVSDGKMTRKSYRTNHSISQKIISKLKQSGLPLGIINDVHSFNLAIEEIESQDRMSPFEKLISEDFNLGSPIEPLYLKSEKNVLKDWSNESLSGYIHEFPKTLDSENFPKDKDAISFFRKNKIKRVGIKGPHKNKNL